MPKYGSNGKKSGSKEMGHEDVGRATLSSKRPWQVPSGSPEPPGDTQKVPHPK